MYLLDTNHCGEIIKNNPEVCLILDEQAESGASISIIVYGELLYMAEKSRQKDQNKKLINDFLEQIKLYFLDEDTGVIYSQLKVALFENFAPKDKAKRRRTTLQNLGFGENDLWIAATALQHNLILVSADSDFTRIQEVCDLQLESWISES
jgi:tRNA(fMet)-specific endonuclease VapC